MIAVLAYIGAFFLALALGVGAGMAVEHKTGSEEKGSLAFFLVFVAGLLAFVLPMAY